MTEGHYHANRFGKAQKLGIQWTKPATYCRYRVWLHKVVLLKGPSHDRALFCSLHKGITQVSRSFANKDKKILKKIFDS